ncbi:peptidase C14, caspase domain-containing protein [Dichomitus squalens]|uniref:Peptidase C14, caspase domain-containing protein n=1 Tax=Dichomitus squalens TaxID=114155 RepID=A0A4Q9M9U9_9APHY|nr:peptidase C14, caspase domain-containing protein [Dichomitus squalens]
MPTATNQGGDKKALIVGVTYKHNHNLRQNNLPVQPGASRDAEKLKKLLMEVYHYHEQDIVVMTDANDTRQDSKEYPNRKNIMEAMKRLVEDRQHGDHVVFAFSGHGGQVDAVVDQKEKDKKDEILMPADCEIVQVKGQYEYKNYILDDELRQTIVDSLDKGVRCTMIFDCCSSGTASDLPYTDSPDPTDSPELTASPDTPTRSTSGGYVKGATVSDANATGSSNLVPQGGTLEHVISWSACLDGQVTFGKRTGGIFLEAFTRILLGPKSEYTNRDLLAQLRKEVDIVTAKANKNSIKGNLYETPQPQFGSLYNPESILDEPFLL